MIAIANNIVCKPIKDVQGPILVEKNEKTRKAEVLFVGPDVKEVSVGDMIYFKSGLSYREVKVNDEEYLICNENDIFAKESNKRA
jgi:co-chaperonin GroES (HSP10)